MPDETKLSRRELLKYAAASMTLLVSCVALGAPAPGSVGIIAVRVWPAPDYTRVTLEYRDTIKFTHMLVKDPYRLVLDLEGVEFDSVLQSLPNKISADDPYIKLIRAGRNKPGVVRLVIELKAEVRPQVFLLKPVGEYGHRLVLDLYPVEPVDPLLALLRQSESKETAPASPPEKTNAKAGVAEKPKQTDAVAERDKPREAESARDGEKAPIATRNKAPERGDDKPVVTRMVTVMLDPGHGGEDPGAVGARGSYEKNVVLSIARLLKEKIDAQPNMRSLLTRDGDYFIPLGQRVQKARRVQADLFLSIHADAFVKTSARGSSVFVLSEHGASSSAARWLAKKENAADLIGGVNLGAKDPFLARTLLDLSQTATSNDSLKLGRAVLGEIGNINQLHSGSVEQAAFAVLKAPDIPSILVETAFISNPAEEARLNDNAYQEHMADAILHGIKRYFAKNPPPAKSRQA